MHILVFNSGSSSLKFQLFEVSEASISGVMRGIVHHFGEAARCEWVHGGVNSNTAIIANDHASAARWVLELLENGAIPGLSLLRDVAAIGHRIVHGGNVFTDPTRITDEMLSTLDTLTPLAPLHNPPALSVIRMCQNYLDRTPMVAVFDTAFFHGLPEHVRTYALPLEWRKQTQEIRRYGFHGLAHRYLYERYIEIRETKAATSRVISLQLGQGCSIAAIQNGHARETSMGFTPLEGLIMATRPGDLDVGVAINLLEQGDITIQELNEGMNHRSGLLGLSGISADMKTLLSLEAQGHSGAKLAIDAFCHRARKYLGAYLAVLGGADAILFGGGIGEHANEIRKRICAGMEWCGLELDVQANQSAVGIEARISMSGNQPEVYVIPVDEESLIARDTYAHLKHATV